MSLITVLKAVLFVVGVCLLTSFQLWTVLAALLIWLGMFLSADWTVRG